MPENIDLTPRMAPLIPALLQAYMHTTPQKRAEIQEEFIKIATAADFYYAHAADAKKAPSADQLMHGAVLDKRLLGEVITAVAGSGNLDLAERLFIAGGGRSTEEERLLYAEVCRKADEGEVSAIDNDGTTETATDAVISIGDDPGAYLQTWTWVEVTEEEREVIRAEAEKI